MTKKGISRRDLIKKGAVAGAVFWSVPVIESVTSRAAAQSGCVSFNASWIYVVYTVAGHPNQYFFTGFSAADSGGGSCTPGSNPHAPVSQLCGGVTFTLQQFSGTPTNGDVTVDNGFTVTYVGMTGSPNCMTYLSINGGDVTPAQSGVTIVAAFCFGANKLSGACPSGSNSTCANCG